jgi:hypothetical protein
VVVVVADLPPEKARQYRLVDNKTGELTSWDYNSLVLELREWDEALLASFFPEISLDISSDAVAQQTTIDQIALAEEKVHTLPGWEPVDAVELVCPNCFHTFAVRRDSVESLLVGNKDQATIEIGGQVMTEAQFNAAQFPLLNDAPATTGDADA